MSAMIEQLLDFTSARPGGGIPVNPSATDMVDLCDQVVGEFEAARPEREIRFDSVGDSCGTWDSERLLQVLSNLLGNACDHGSIDAPVLIKIDGRDAGKVCVEVRNQGAIPDSLLLHIFDPFRSTRHQREQSRGLGLGLFIVREIVRGHGGSVDVHSTESDGTTFTLQLPRHVPRSK
jgi:signal transduction histidine kinase